jgi:hypothetical protein
VVSGASASAQVPTMPYTDTSTHVATTSFVRSLFATRGQGDAIYIYNGATISGDPGNGNFIIQPGTGAARQIAISKVDADTVGRYLLLFQPGDTMIITNEFTPVTAYARYDVVDYPIDHGTWVELATHFIDSQGIITPAVGTRVKLTGYLNTATGDAPITGVAAGTYLTGGGSAGVVNLDVDITKIAVLASPVFSGNPTGPTPLTADSSVSLATTAFVKNQGYLTTATAGASYQPLDADLTALAGLSATPGLVEQTGAAAYTKRAMGVAAATSVPTRADADARYSTITHSHPESDITNLTTDLAAKAPLASPAFTGTPTVTGAIPAPQTNTTQIATCAFVQQEIAADLGGYLPLSGGVVTGNFATSGGYIMVDRSTDAIAAVLNMRADAGFAESIFFQTGATGVNRWTLGKNATAESGSSAGSDFQLVAFNDAGTSLGSVFTVARATRVMDFQVSPTVPTVTPATDNTGKVASTAFVQSVVAAGTGAYLPLAGGTLSGQLLGTTLGLGTATAPVGTLQVKGAGQNTAAVSTSATLGATITVQDTGAAVNNGGMVMFGASQGFFAAIKGLIGVGTTNTTGDLVISTRRLVGDAALTETARFGFSGATTLAGPLTATAASFTTGAFSGAVNGTSATFSGSVAAATASLSGALTYGGVALTAGVTGTGKMVLDNSPVFTGNPTAPTPAPGDNDTSLATTAFVASAVAGVTTPPGVIVDFAGLTAPAGWLLCNGAAVSRTTYANLLTAVTATSVVTITIAAPAVLTWNAHGMIAGDRVSLETTGALPTGLAVGTNYYVVSPTANTFQLSATMGGAAINASGTQSGVHTARRTPWGCGNGTTTFNVPDLRGSVTAGMSNMGNTTDSANMPGGALLGWYQGWYQQSVTINSGGTNNINFGNVGFSQQYGYIGSASLNDQITGIGNSLCSTGDQVYVGGYVNVNGNFGINVTGTSPNFSILQPTTIVNKIIKT